MRPPSPEMRELTDGVADWRSRTTWPDDFHNTCYQTWARDNPHGNFTPEWWQCIRLPTLKAWKATRGVKQADMTARFSECATALSAAWQLACVPFLDRDISAVTWKQISAFPKVVAEIRPTKVSSPVFSSKFCHSLLPKIFPVVDRRAVGNRRLTYEAYFRSVQNEWEFTRLGHSR